MKSYVKDYPRPQFVRKSWQNLNGQWDFSFDDMDAGERNQWYHNFPKARKIEVPFTYETELSGIHDETAHQAVWYRRTFSVDREKIRGKDLMLRFEGSDYHTKVWINGNYAGSHKGGYTRFSFCITDLVSPGINEIVVKVEDSLDEQQPRGKQRWKNENFGCWYVQTTGIWKTVWMETVPKDHIESIKLTPDLGRKVLNLTAAVSLQDSGKNCSLRAEVSFKDRTVAIERVKVLGGRISFAIKIDSTEIDEWGVKIWRPESPDLYDLRLTLLCGEDRQDEILSYFGMRDIGVSDGHIMLNGAPLYQRLILDQGYWKKSGLTPPNEQALVDDIKTILSMGYNGVRIHQKIEDERFLYWCDVLGLLVWSEMPAAYQFTDRAVYDFTIQWMDAVRQNYNHPSVIVWTPFNESWGVGEVKTDRTQQHFTEAVYHLTKSFDKNRPVITNDGWEHTISDILTLHDYEESGEKFFKRYTEHREDILDGHYSPAGSRMAFADGFSHRGLPVVISEFGGIAFDGSSGWGYGHKVNNLQEFLTRFSKITAAIQNIPYVCGYCYTQLNDVQQEVNGLLDENHHPKIDCSKIRAVNLGKKDDRG